MEDAADSAATEHSDGGGSLEEAHREEAEVRGPAGHDAMEAEEASGRPDIGHQLATADTIPLDMDVDLPPQDQPSAGTAKRLFSHT